MEKVEFSEWATPMVHVPKVDGTTSSCGDYAVTVNPQLNIPQYPIPLPEDVFVKLRGGKLFTKLDFKNTYQQLPLDPDSQRNHQHTSWSVSVQKVAIWCCLVPGNLFSNSLIIHQVIN